MAARKAAVAVPVVEEVKKPVGRVAKAPAFPKGIPTEKGCTAMVCEGHTTYTAEDPHCRKPFCENFIDRCPTHIRPKAIAKLAEEKKAAAAAKIIAPVAVAPVAKTTSRRS